MSGSSKIESDLLKERAANISWTDKLVLSVLEHRPAGATRLVPVEPAVAPIALPAQRSRWAQKVRKSTT